MSKNFGLPSFAERAMLQARSISAARYDLAHYIFPKSNFPIDEHLIAGIKNSLYMMVFNIERSILRQSNMQSRISTKSLSYPVLMESGLLNDNDILDVALSLFHFRKLSLNDGLDCYEIAQRLALHNDINVKECAQTLALACSRFKSLGLGNFFELPPEILQRLTWRIVATFEVIDGKIAPNLIEAVSQWLAGYSEAETIAAASRKLAYLMRDQELTGYWRFNSSDAALFIALIEQKSSIDRRVIINILADRSPLLSGLLFRAVDMPLTDAIANIMSVFHTDDDIHSKAISQISDEYLSITPGHAHDMLKTWSSVTPQIDGGDND